MNWQKRLLKLYNKLTSIADIIFLRSRISFNDKLEHFTVGFLVSWSAFLPTSNIAVSFLVCSIIVVAKDLSIDIFIRHQKVKGQVLDAISTYLGFFLWLILHYIYGMVI